DDPAELGAWQPEEEHLEEQEEGGQRDHRQGDARRGARDDLEHRAQRSNIRSSSTAMIGPIEANPRSPKPSDTLARPAMTELRPSASAITTGAVSTPVVTLPAS